jgi:cyclopropane-fatty-acyl-phospholipid synthase
MASQRYRRQVEGMLAAADIRINGDRPWDVQVLNDDLFTRVIAEGTLGAGEAYMDGWWDCEQLDEMICRAYRAGVQRSIRPAKLLLYYLQARVMNLQRRARAFQVGRQHYDLGRDLYRAMLDRRMIYSCAYWRRAATLDEAQEHKLDLVAHKLGLEPGMHVLDIGCGWGGALHYFASRYGVSGVGVTVSEDQHAAARELTDGQRVEIRLQDYRELEEPFDRIYSIGMFEHVGYKNYATYMDIVGRCLSPEGLFLLHTIGGKISATRTDPWICRYIFPNGMLPSARQIAAAAEGRLNLEDWHNFPQDYDRTLMCWYANFERAWPDIEPRYGERFFRMWRYYLLASAGSFRAGGNQLWQVVYSRDGVPGGYTPDEIR